MAGHSHAKNVMHQKGAQDRKKAKIFTQISRAITVSVREGGKDPQINPRLRLALDHAKGANMPKDVIQRAINRGEGVGTHGNYEDVLYEAFLPGGIGLLIEVNTDNRNRSVSEIRALLTRHNGNLGESNSVAFLFKRQGMLVYEEKDAPFERLLEKSIEVGAQDVVTSEKKQKQEGDLPQDSKIKGEWKEYGGKNSSKDQDSSSGPQEQKSFVLCQLDNFSHVGQCLQEAFGEAKENQLVWLVDVAMPINDPYHRETLETVLEKLEGIEGVYGLWHNGANEDQSLPAPWNT